jgi:hypothetical protein
MKRGLPIAIVIGIGYVACHHEFERQDEFKSTAHIIDTDETLKAKQDVFRKTITGDMFSELTLDVEATPTSPAWHAKLNTTGKTQTQEDRSTNTDSKKSSNDSRDSSVAGEGEVKTETDLGPGFKFYLAGGIVLALLGAFAVWAIKHKIWSPL